VPATCAICLQPIVARNDVRVFGTEVMHRACASSGQETIGQRHQREIADLRRELVSTQESERRQALALQQERRRALNSERAARMADERVDERVDKAELERDEAVSRQVQAEIARDAAIRERNAARADLAKHTSAPEAPQIEDQRDDTIIRMSLLDMD
jgi:hypothetical protein